MISDLRLPHGVLRTVQVGARTITAEDLVRFATIGNPQSIDWKGQYRLAEEIGEFSPDGRLLAIVVGRGNPKEGTNDSTVLLYTTEDLLRRHSRPDAVVDFASKTNYQPIAYLRWLADSEAFVFAGTRGRELSQVYRFSVRTHEIEQLTRERAQLLWYDITPSGQTLVWSSGRTPRPPGTNDACKSRGCRVTAESLWDAIDGVSSKSARISVRNLLTGRITVLPSPELRDGTIKRCDDSLLGGISPDGRFALRVCEIKGKWPDWWSQYTNNILRECWERRGTNWPNAHCGRRLMLVDLETGETTALSEAPFIPWIKAEPVWIDDGRHVVLVGVLEPLGSIADGDKAGGASTLVSVLINPVTREVTRIADLDPRTARVSGLSWNASAETLTIKTESVGGASLPLMYLRRRDGRWNATERRPANVHGKREENVQLVLKESLNEPPRVMVKDEKTGELWPLLDPNPWLEKRRLGTVEEISWRSDDGRTWHGGLYYPPNYMAAKRYPLVLQTHGFQSNQFSLHGIARVFAGQALAAQDMVVLQIKENFLDVINTPKEWTTVQAGYEAAIDHLDRLEIIDPARVGIQGWSRTGPQVGYTLTHSTYQFAAAALTESGDFGWLWYLMAGAPPTVDGLFGAAPFGDGLAIWRKYSPTFNLDKVRTPMLMWEARSVVGLWDWYAGLRRLKKPVEYWFLPDGVHDTFQVNQRMHTTQLLVDWFRFWLKGEEDPSPAKVGQYARWRKFRTMQQANRIKTVPDLTNH